MMKMFFHTGIVARLAVPALLAFVIAGCSTSEPAGAGDIQNATMATGVSTDPQVNEILKKSCYTCHSTGGTAPWYAAVSPTYLAANSARRALNFSDWTTYDAVKKAAELKNIADSIQSGAMPPGDYTALDHAARLSDDDKQALLTWVTKATAPVSAQ
jgi:hypothetical protein